MHYRRVKKSFYLRALPSRKEILPSICTNVALRNPSTYVHYRRVKKSFYLVILHWLKENAHICRTNKKIMLNLKADKASRWDG